MVAMSTVDFAQLGLTSFHGIVSSQVDNLS